MGRFDLSENRVAPTVNVTDGDLYYDTVCRASEFDKRASG